MAQRPSANRSRTTGYIVVLLTASPFGVDAQSCSPDWGPLEGRVLEESSGLPLPGSRVVARWQEERSGDESATDTDAEGRFHFDCLPPTTVTFVARVAQFTSSAISIDLRESSDPVDLSIDLLEESTEVGRMLGRVVDRETGRPVSGVGLYARPASATVEDTWSRQQMTNSDGAFVLEELDPGDYDVSVRHIGYEQLDQRVTVPEGRTVELQVELSVDPIELEPLFVTTTRSRRLEVKGFYERRRWGERLGLGDFFTREDIERRNPMRISHMMGDLGGIELICSKGFATRGCQVRMRRTPQNYCRYAAVYIDGIKAIDPERRSLDTIDDLIHPSDVGGIEVYKSGAEVPGEFAGSTSQCGAVVIWSRGGG